MDPILFLIAIGVCLIAYAVLRPAPEPAPELLSVLKAMKKIDEEAERTISLDQEAVEADINARYPDHKS